MDSHTASVIVASVMTTMLLIVVFSASMLADEQLSVFNFGSVMSILGIFIVIVVAGVTLFVDNTKGAPLQGTASQSFTSRRSTIRQLAKTYQTNHPDEKPITLNSNSNDDDDDDDAPLPDVPDTNKVTKVFYTSADGTVVSGGQSDYREALKSKNVVYVFVK